MKEIKVFVHDGRLMQEPYHIWDTNVDAYIAEWKQILFPLAQKADMDHYVYCTKIYDKDDNLIELNIYMQPLNENEFMKRTNFACEAEKKNGNSIWFGCWHKGTSY